MKFFHGTSQRAWEAIQEEGTLWGVRGPVRFPDGFTATPSRCTYLTEDRLEAAQYGDVVLEVEYEPGQRDPNGRPLDNHNPDSWQCRVYVPILLTQLKRIEEIG